MPPDPLNRTGAIVTLAAAAFGAIGSIGPWATVIGLSVNGTDDGGDGIGTLAVMVIVAALAGASLYTGRNRFGGIVFIFGLAAAALGIYDMARLDSSTSELAEGAVNIGWGLWLTILGSLGVAAGGFLTAFNTEYRRRGM